MSGGSYAATLRDLGNGAAAAAGRALDRVPRLAGGDHAGDLGVALGVLGTALVVAFGLRLGLALRLTAAAIVIVLASDGGEHVEQHAVDGLEHPACELVADPTRHRPARRQVERDDADTLGGKLSPECFPVRCSEAGQPVDLLEEETVALMGISQKPEQLRPGELGATLVLNVPSHNLEPVLGSEGLDLGPGAVGVL